MVIRNSEEAARTIRQVIFDLSKDSGISEFLRKALAISLLLHIACVLYYLLVFVPQKERQALEALRIKTGREQAQSIPLPQAVAVAVVKATPMLKPVPPAPPPLPAPSKWVAAKKPVEKPAPPKIIRPTPKPMPELSPAPPPPSMTPPEPELPSEIQGPPVPPAPPAVAAAAQPRQGAVAKGYEQGTDALAEQELPEDYGDILFAWVNTHVRPEDYPDNARKEGWRGLLKVEVTVEPDGSILSYIITRTSGYPELDNAIRTVLLRANPAPTIPPGETRRTFELAFCFNLSPKGRVGPDGMPPECAE